MIPSYNLPPRRDKKLEDDADEEHGVKNLKNVENLEEFVHAKDAEDAENGGDAHVDVKKGTAVAIKEDALYVDCKGTEPKFSTDFFRIFSIGV